jgi:acetamidase/formamidase
VGTAIETSFTVTVRVSTIKQSELPPEVAGLNFPLLETPTEYIVHGSAAALSLTQSL